MNSTTTLTNNNNNNNNIGASGASSGSGRVSGDASVGTSSASSASSASKASIGESKASVGESNASKAIIGASAASPAMTTHESILAIPDFYVSTVESDAMFQLLRMPVWADLKTLTMMPPPQGAAHCERSKVSLKTVVLLRPF